MILTHKFSVGFHNLQGLHSCSGCKINEIKGEICNDIEILAETWGCNCVIVLDNYTIHKISPQKHQGVKKGRKSGGFIILIKNALLKDVKIVKTSNNFVWMEVNKKYIANLENNFFIVGTYINDITSTYYDDKICQELHTHILNFNSNNSPILIMGEFNGRTGNLDDIYRDDMKVENVIPTPNFFEHGPKRRNCDEIINSHGKKIIDFCHSFDFKILNGTTMGDRVGNFTHLNANNGESTIDYALCNHAFYECIDNFMVLPMIELSDHSKIITTFKSSIPIRNVSEDTYNWNNLKTKFKWNPKNKKAFVDGFKNNVNDLDEISQRLEAGLIDSTGEKIQNLYMKVAKLTLEAKRQKLEKKKKI